MLIIGILITANSAYAIPQGTVLKEGVLTYPAGPYLTEDPLLLSHESCGDDSKTQASEDSLKKISLKKECLCFDYNSETIILGNLGAGNLWICPSNLLYIYYDCNTEIMQPEFSFLCGSISPSFNLITLSTPFNATSR